MNLHIEIHGNGHPLVMLHGWGMHGGMWGDFVPQLACQREVHCLDLPGYGNSATTLSSWTLDAVVDVLAASFIGPVDVCGWSLGGQIALSWADRYPQQVRSLIMLASTPCFAQKADWQQGMDAATLQQFAEELERDHAATLRRFLALQVRGSDNERALLSSLRAHLTSRPQPDIEAMRAGLAILREADLRALLPQVSQPTLVIAGERDKLTPASASRWMAQALQDARYIEIEGAAHAPFLSHPEIVLQHVTEFLHG